MKKVEKKMYDRIKKKILADFAFYIMHESRVNTRLLSFQNGREQCRKRLWEAGRKHKASILNYHISPEKLQVLLHGNSEQMTELIKNVAANTAADHRRRTNKEGPFWRKRFKATLIQHGIHMLRCNLAMDMTMVLQEKSLYPGEWPLSGYQEIIDVRKRYRIINLEKCAKLSGFQDYESMRIWYLEQMNTGPGIVILKLEDLNTAVAMGDLENIELTARCFPRRCSEIKLCCEDKFGKSYGLFVSEKAKRLFTRSLK